MLIEPTLEQIEQYLEESQCPALECGFTCVGEYVAFLKKG